MMAMIGQVPGIDHDVVDVDDDEAVEELPEEPHS